MLSLLLLAAAPPFGIEVRDADGDFVPLVELRTTDHQRFVSDNAGRIAVDGPDLLEREVWFGVEGRGYEVPADGFGFRGVRLMCEAGGSAVVTVTRTLPARRLGRLTGRGLFAESMKLFRDAPADSDPAAGKDSVQTAALHGRRLWLWGDTTPVRYPLGVFHMTGAWTDGPLDAELPVRPPYEPILDDDGRPAALAEMPGEGPTWLTHVGTVRDGEAERVVAVYRKIRPPLTAYEVGLCVFDPAAERFAHLRTVWREADGPHPPVLAEGHPVPWTDEAGREWLLIGNPLPHAKVPAEFAAWRDVGSWVALEPQKSVPAKGGAVRPHSGSIDYCPRRRRWVAVFTGFGDGPAPLSDVWYAEAESPLGPWGGAVRVATLGDHTFYNPRLHPMRPDGVLLFEGTYSKSFAGDPPATPRWDYNQVLYRLDADFRSE